MMHHHTKFGSKRFSDSQDTIWTNIHYHSEICYDLDLEHNNPFSPEDILTYDSVPSNQVW